MKLVFWLSLALVAYTYFGYPLYLLARVRAAGAGKKFPLPASTPLPTLSILIAARNEEATLPAKLANLAALDYPPGLVQLIIVSDGSTDRTPAILLEHASRIVPLILETPVGKAAALNHAVRHATGELLVFLDARQTLDRRAVAELASCFVDHEVGAVSGELLLAQTPNQDALGIYWKLEKAIRRLESLSGSVIGVTGALYAMRRALYIPIPPGTILDDVLIPMQVARQSRRVLFHPAAIAYDRLQPGKEFARKVRTLTGNYQLLRLAPWLLSPANPLFFRFVSHKLMRLAVPWLLLAMLLASAVAAGAAYRLLFSCQVLFYTLAVIGVLLPSAKRLRPIAIASTFVTLNTAAAVALFNFLTKRTKIWT